MDQFQIQIQIEKQTIDEHSFVFHYSTCTRLPQLSFTFLRHQQKHTHAVVGCNTCRYGTCTRTAADNHSFIQRDIYLFMVMVLSRVFQPHSVQQRLKMTARTNIFKRGRAD
jgi:hypothetical protein